MKRIIAILLCLAMLVLAACEARSLAAAETAAPTPTPAATPMPEATAEATETPADAEQKTAETEAELAAHAPAYGERVWMEADQEGFSGAVAYPSGFEALDIALEEWANATMKAYEQKAKSEAMDADGMKGELYVTYNSYELNDRYIGVKEIGVYEALATGATEGVVYTANYDTVGQKLLTINDVVGKEHLEAINALLSEHLAEAGKSGLAAAGKLTEHFVITDTGLTFLYAKADDFYQCTLPYNLIIDYMALFNSDPTPTPSAAPASASKPEIVEEALCTKNGAHVRAEADAKAATLAVIQAGAVLEVVKQDAGNGFTEIWYENASAYVRTSFLAFSTTVADPETPDIAAKGYITGKGVHVRADASTRAKKLGTLQYGDEVSIVTAYYTDAWHQILFQGQIAYVSARYISIGSMPAETPKPSEIVPDIVGGPPYVEFVGTCSTNGVIVRSKTSVKSDYYCKLYAGDEVQVIESECRSGWDKVWIPTNHSNTRGYVGYVHSKYIDDWSQVVPVAQRTPEPAVPVIEQTPVPVIPVVPQTPVPVITSNPLVGGHRIGTGVTVDEHAIGTGVTVNP